jgi:hypothetical protein
MLKAKPSSLFSWAYDLYEDEKLIAQMGMSWFKEGGRFVWEGGEYQLSREGLWSGSFLLQLDGRTLAEATKVSPFFRCFDVRVGERTLMLKAASVFTREFHLIANDTLVGSVAPDGFFSRQCTISFPDDLPRPVQVFLFWLVILMWRRAAQSSSSS